MASYTRLIEFKVKDTELNRAVNKLSKTLDRIDKSLVGIDKKLDHIAKQGFGGVAKEANKAEKSVGKLNKSLKSIWNTSGPQGFAKIISGGVLGTLLGKKGDIADAVVRIGALDGAIRLLTKGNTGLPALQRRIVDATMAIGGFTIANAGAIAGITAGSAAILTGTKLFYDFGRSVRQAEANLIDFIRTEKESGRSIGQTLKSLMPKWKSGSRLGGADSGGPNIGLPPSSPIGVGSSRGLEVVRPKLIQSQIAGVTKLNRELARSQEIQDNINASIRGPYRTAVVAVKQAQFAYNLELQKARVIQAAVNADIWLAQKAWQAVIGTLKGATGLVGKVFGKFLQTDVGKGTGVIALTRSIEALTGKLGFLNQAWIKNINTVALWSARASEAITAVSIGYSGLNAALGAANWTVGAIKGFVDFERKAVEVFHNINAARRRWERDSSTFQQNTLLQNLFGPLSQMVRGRMGNKLKEIYGGKDAAFSEGGAFRGMSDRTPYHERLANEIDNQREKLAALHSSHNDYAEEVHKLAKLEARVTAELELQNKIKEETLAVQKKLQQMEERDRDPARKVKEHNEQIEKGIKREQHLRAESIKRGRALREKADKQIKAAGQERFKEVQRRWKLEESNHRKEVQRIKERNRLARQRRRERGAAIGRFGENLMLGAGFPMLFGGGPGAVVGGVTGAIGQSALGSKGFGMQILFSALGQQVDAFAAKTAELGKAFNKLNPDVDSVIKALGETNTVYGKHLEMLKKIKGESAAMAEATRKLAGLIGDRGVAGLKKYGEDMQKLANAWTQFSTLIMTSLAEWINASGILVALTKSISRAARFKSAKRAAEGGDVEMAILFAQRKALQNQMISGRDEEGDRVRMSVKEFEKALNAIDNKIDAAELKRQAGLVKTGDLFGAGADKTIEFEKKKKISEADIFDLNEQIKLEKERLNLKEGQFEIQSRQIEINRQILEISWTQSRLDELEKENLTKEEELEKKNLKIKIAKLIAEKDLSQAQLDNLKILNDVNDKYRQIGDTIKDGIVDAIESAVEGTKTLGEVASQVLKQIAKQILTSGVNSFFNTLGNKNQGNWLGSLFGGQRAKGGPVTGGTSYLVGEKGPELFTPKSSGHITANDGLGGSVINVSVDANGSSAEGDADKGRELGRMLGAAIQAELLKQQRPGGILSR